MTTADEPSAVRTTVVMAMPSAAKAAAPVRIAKTKSERPLGPVGVQQEDAEQELRDDLEGDHDDRRADHRGEVGGRGQRRPAYALQEAGLAPDDERDGKAREGVRGHAVAEQPDEEERRRVDALDRLVAVDRADEDEQEDGEEEAEERRLAVPPEELLLGPQLVEEQPHPSPSSRVSSR